MKSFKLKTLIFLFVLTLFISCSPEPAPSLTTKEIITEIAREWTVNEIGDDIPITYTSRISADPSHDDRILMSNFHNSNTTLYAIVKEDNSIELPFQSIDNQDFQGSGDISNDFTRITLNYSIDFDGGTVNITATFTYGITS